MENFSNNKAPTGLACFLKGVHTYDLQENVLVADCMIKERGSGRGSMITGPSIHNRRTERLWKDVLDGMIGSYYELFSFMEENSIDK